MKNLKTEFLTLTQNLSLWNEIENAYKGRDYHNLSHLENMYLLLCEVKSEIEDWDVLMFAMFYHDFVYDVLRNDNEKRSAELSKSALTKICLPYDKQKKVYELIMATKGHNTVSDKDSAFFVDVDLAILGMDDYERYEKAIRKEYAVFSDIEYRAGRQKVIDSFLKMPRIYQSEYFYEKFEHLARKNLQRENAIIQSKL